MNNVICDIKNKVINEKYTVTKDDALMLYTIEPYTDLCMAANEIREKCAGSISNVCSIINAKQGGCSEDCKYCAQSAHWKTACQKIDMISSDDAVKFAVRALENSVFRISLVTAGRGLGIKDFDHSIECIKNICIATNYKMKVCASFGIINEEKMRKLKASGVTRYHHNLETSQNYYPKICSTHTYQERIATIEAAKKVGLDICCGGIIGMGETREDRIDLAMAIKELHVQSVPINILTPIKGTPFETVTPLTRDEILKTFAIFRFIMPSQVIRCAAGRKNLGDNGKAAFLAGANALISGDFLTTEGSTNKEDIDMLKMLGYSSK